MKKLTYILVLLTIGVFLNSCSDEPEFTKNLNYITFEALSLDMGVDPDGTAEHEVKVFTTQVTGSDRTFNINVLEDVSTADPASYTVPATVTVPANSNVGIITIGISDINIGDAGETLVLDLAAEDGLFKGEATTINLSQNCYQNDVRISIEFDNWGSECSWELLNSADEVVGSGSGYADGDTGAFARFCLEDGTYTFVINDVYGDGGSTVTITNNGTAIVSIDPAYGFGTSETFSVNM